jgi:BolA protein
MSTSDQIKQLLEQSFHIHSLEIIDESHKHAGHAEAKKSGGGHFRIVMVSPDFEGKTLIQRHRMVYDALKPIAAQIHALSIKAEVYS